MLFGSLFHQAQEKVEELKNLFYDYMKSKNEIMEPLAELYNDRFNDFIEKKYSLPSFVHFPGANPDITLRLHQRRAVARALKDSVLLAYQVGTGKTYTMITTAMEQRRLGIAKKPMIVVQNATLEQFAKDFLKLYPGANILAPTAKEMDAPGYNFKKSLANCSNVAF
jgi:N12 class adenine-specific DNA methylase